MPPPDHAFPESGGGVRWIPACLAIAVFASTPASSSVVINEFMSAPSERQLKYGPDSVASVGSGVRWQQPEFPDAGWFHGRLPAGYGFAGLSTNLQTAMQNKSPSLYLRKAFTVSAADSASASTLSLVAECNDGFVAWLNGVEVARANMGAPRHFLYHDQPAYNPASTAGLVEFQIGVANARLVPGANVLALQAHNAERPGSAANESLYGQHLPTPEFKINAGLRLEGPTVTLIRSAFNFDDASGGSKSHTNSGGTITNTSSGTLAPGGWLETAADPQSAATWQNLQIVSAENPTGGVNESGGLVHTITQSGPSQAALLRAPAAALSGAWTPGQVNQTTLQNTTLSFRYRTTGNARFQLRLDPSLTDATNVIDGFPVIGLPLEPPPDFSWSTAAAGLVRFSISDSGSTSAQSVGTVRHTYYPFASPTFRNGQFELNEDNAIPSPAGGGNGVLRFRWRQLPTQSGSSDYWGWVQPGFTVPEWTAGSIANADLAKTRFTFRYKLPPGRSLGLFLQPEGGAYANRCDLGTISGTGAWQTFNKTLSQGTNLTTFLAYMNSRPTVTVDYVIGQASAITGYQADEDFQFDDLNLYFESESPDPDGWRHYEVSLGAGSQGPTGTRFVNALNAASSVTFVPAFTKLTDAPAGGQTLAIDDFEFRYQGPASGTSTDLLTPGPTSGDWNFFVGLAEPSGGVFDPGLLTGFSPPPGEEADFERPDQFVDWVELKNSGPNAVDLGGWSLTDDPAAPDKWRFPAGTLIPAGGYLIVLCDDREEANAPAGPATLLHAGFQLDGDGESLFLLDASGAPIDQIIDPPNQTSFQSYGRNPGAESEWGFLETATPGSENAGAHFPARCEPPESFKADGLTPMPGGKYTGPQSLALVSATSGSAIRYTTDGSDPSETNGINYVAPIPLSPPNDRTGIVIRARAFQTGWLPSGIKSHTYLVNQNSALAAVPALILTGTDDQVFYKPHGILSIQGGTYQSTNSGSVWVHSGPDSYNIAIGQGRPFERETHLEFYPPPGYYPPDQEALAQDVGLRLSSSPYQRPRMKLATTANSPWLPWWEATERPSFNIYWRGDFGPAELDYPIFPGYDVRKFQSLRLRAGKNDSGGDSPFITDELVRRLWIDMGHVGAKGLICALYVNGQWKNIGNLTERIREPLLQQHYRSESPWDVRYVTEWVNGNPTAWNQMVAALNTNLATLSNYQALESKLDLDNFADYYLLNIYAAMWDWPENNFAFARERSTGPQSVFRYLVWDAEGGFNVKSYYAKGVEFNSLTSDLQTKNVDVANFWKRLILSPEWKLKFADRVHRHLFNGGVLDDRDPDGAGPLVSHFQRRIDELASEAGPMVQLYSSMNFTATLSKFATWTAPASGRRTYLLGSAAGRRFFRDAGLWPATEPPVFSQHGGVVPAGYPLTMTATVATSGQSSVIHYTMDGSDPRAPGGSLSPAATEYAAAIPLDSVGTIKARARNSTTAEWSPLTEATFLVAAVPASISNLVIGEIMYHPPDATAAEEAAGFNNADDFEFIRLANIGNEPVDLDGVTFVEGVTFDFSSGHLAALNPGGAGLVVRNRAAFLMRYGPSYAPLIAGEFTGGLANDGERLTLNGPDGQDPGSAPDVLRDFIYLDQPPWPAPPDGDGPSLILVDPHSNPDHSIPANWTASAVLGGLPNGGARPVDYAAWRSLVWNPADAAADAISGPNADADADGLANLAEFAVGLDPRRPDAVAPLLHRIESMGSQRFLVIEYRRPGSLSGASVVPEVSADALTWKFGAPDIVDHALPIANVDGSITHTVRHSTPVDAAVSRFVRLRISMP